MGKKAIKAKKERVRRPFPRATLEQALKIPSAIKDHNGGNPWEPEEIRRRSEQAPGAMRGSICVLHPATIGLTIGTSSAQKIELAEIGREIVYAPNPEAERKAKLGAFLSVEIFNRVLQYYKGSNLVKS